MSGSRGIYTQEDHDVAMVEVAGGVGLDVLGVELLMKPSIVGAAIGVLAVAGSVGLYVDAFRRWHKDHTWPPESSDSVNQ